MSEPGCSAKPAVRCIRLIRGGAVVTAFSDQPLNLPFIDGRFVVLDLRPTAREVDPRALNPILGCKQCLDVLAAARAAQIDDA